MELKEARANLMQLQKKTAAYAHAMGLISYDGVTTAPKGTAANRGVTLSVLSEEIYKLAVGKDTVELLNYLDENKDQLTEKEQRMVYLLLKDIRSMQKIPMDEYVAYQELMVEADDVWHRAKETSDFALFEPYLEKIFETNIRFAGYQEPGKDPYDHWLNEYENGLSCQVCDAFFDKLKSRLVPLIAKAVAAPPVQDDFLYKEYPYDKQEELALYLMDVLKVDKEHCGLSTTEHPFTTSLGSHFDERITTNYDLHNVASSLYSVVHESGHAMYDMGSADDLAYTALDGGTSMGIHESQSRFYENLIGRSRAFVELIYPKMQELFPEQLAGVTAEDFYRAVNKTQPSLVRVDADEVTYCLHIMVRYELEKRVMAGELKVHDLPAEWNRLYKEYLGVDVPNDKQGVLQDSHWSGGMIGYFPSYALGSAYGVQFLNKMKETVDVEECLRKGDLGPINEWNREHIWQFGSFYEPGDLLKKVLGGEFDPEYYIQYLENKVKDVYGM